MSEVPRPRAGVVTVGSELTSGDRVDTNSAWLSARLERLGFAVWLHRSCPDDADAIGEALAQSAPGLAALVVTGGLGPTRDDLTREGVARAAAAPLELHEASWTAIQERYARYGRVATGSNRRQAELPRGARVLDNAVGTAPGFALELSGAAVWVLPGVPREMRWMWERYVAPALAELAPPGERPAAWSFRTVGIAESALGERLRPIEARPGVEVRYAVEEQLGTIHVTVLAAPGALAEVQPELRELVAHHLCAEGEETLPEALVRGLAEAGLTVATAESCTGGRVAAAITGVAGSSRVFREGLVTYADQAKTRLLGVPDDLIATQGAVCEAVARAMAAGIRERAGVDIGLGVTGIAGPAGGSDEKPVGLVHMAAEGPTDARAMHRVYPGDRALIQARATAGALDLIRRVGLE